MEKSEKTRLKPFMNPSFIKNPYEDVNADFGFGEVKHAGRVDLSKMISILRDDLLNSNAIIDEDFDFTSLLIQKGSVVYKSLKANKIVFCEGHRLSDNPYFNYLPLMRTKGELITVKLEGLNMSELIKSNISILPLGNDLYKVGATFNWDDKDEVCTKEAKNELLEKLKSLVTIEPQLIKQEAGIRPTVKDRRALLGTHPIHDNMYVFNGLGTRGLLISPFLCSLLIDYMENKVDLDHEVDVKRYENEFKC
jgi:glycine/D-amino acid oxidase-like deaminating enzyme